MNFPSTYYFHDIEDGKLKKITVTEKAWEDTFKTFDDKNNVSNNIMQKHLSRHNTVKIEEA